MSTATAPGKAILLGEHAVVYGRPAIAVPISDLRATASVETLPPDQEAQIIAYDLGCRYYLDRTYEDDAAGPLQLTARNTLDHLDIPTSERNLLITVRSEIPIARGLGSGTAVATAIVRALAGHFERHLVSQAVSELVYRTEVLLHGTPSGVDNTVVAFEKPVYFIKERCTDVFWVGKPFELVIADTGIPSRTRDMVLAVRARWREDPARYEELFDQIGEAVDAARQAIAEGDTGHLGALMNRDQKLLHELEVSNETLDELIGAALAAGAKGAKLSGGGGGGCLIALVDEQTRADVSSALLLGGAARVICTTVR